MSDLLDLTVPRPRKARDLAATLETLTTLLVLVAVVAALYVGRDVLVPIAIAVLLSFVLSQPITLLRRLGLGRVAAIGAVVFAALFIAIAVSAALTQQVSELAADLPKYQTTVVDKVSKVRQLVSANSVFEKGAEALKRLGDLDPTRRTAAGPPAPERPGAAAAEEQKPVPVEVRQPEPSPFSVVRSIAGSALSPLETAAIVVIFVIFILLQREDLRNRFIRLAGSSDLQRTTVAMNDAAGRLSRFFLVQTLVNAAFGLVIAASLYLIGVPGFILFGIMAFLLRFVPYIGAIIAAALPVLIAAAVDPGWGMALKTLGLFIVVETVVGNVVEPFLYGRNTGLSPIAVVVAATFWTWLWGPVGLLLATPLTVCLVVIGRHVEQLSFLDVILGDAPALSPVEHFYQRLLVGDAAEVADQAEQFLKTSALLVYYDDVALKGLALAQADLGRGRLDDARLAPIKATIDEVIDNLSDHEDIQPPAAELTAPQKPYGELEAAAPRPAPGAAPLELLSPPAAPRKPVLCIAGRNALDESAAALLAQILDKHGMPAKVEPPELLSVGGILHLPGAGDQIICLSYVGADVHPAQVRYAVRRLRRRLPEAIIIAGFWHCEASAASELCVQTRADAFATRLAEAVSFCVDAVKAAAPPPPRHAAGAIGSDAAVPQSEALPALDGAA